ncbi:MAG: hypothetical protein KF910_01920 [Brevundimonas sp.]|uniref:hypothetical protein n=1 Tax=Brevundimonas sp. TaxID=1871086 RepID=UPI0025BF9516|nr:hypothetical protein [Brevundimonas sp.]MBX3476340.1 hypothetical protein [Brevundimonas sp.]
MKSVTGLAGLLCGAALVASCSYNATFDASDEALNAVADENFRDLAAGRNEAVLARLSSENSQDQARAQLPMLKGLLPDLEAPDPGVASSQKTKSNQGEFYAVRQDYAYPDRTARVETTFKKEGEGWKVRSFNVNVTMRPGAAPATKAGETPPHSD